MISFAKLVVLIQMYKFCKGHMHRGVPNHAKPYILQGSPSGISSRCAYVTKSASWNYVKSFLVCKGRPLPSHWKGYIFQESMGLLVGLLVGLHFQKGDAFVEFVNGYKSSKLFRSNTFLHITLLILRASECFPMEAYKHSHTRFKHFTAGMSSKDCSQMGDGQR